MNSLLIFDLAMLYARHKQLIKIIHENSVIDDCLYRYEISYCVHEKHE